MARIKSLINTRNLLLFTLLISLFLRVYKINKVPISLFSDELDVGYQAYSLIKTGKDYMGNTLPLRVHSYADFRAPFYIYTALPSVAVFGITPLGIRLPAIFFGLLDIYAIYLLANLLIEKKSAIWSLEFGIFPAILLSLSPWHLQYSRAGFEVTELLFFLLMGLYFFLKSLQEEKYLLPSVLSFGMTLWIYNTAVLFIPLLVVFLFFLYKKDILSMTRAVFIRAAVIGGFIVFPVIYSIFLGGISRANYISIFSDPTTIPDSTFQRLLDSQYQGEQRNILMRAESYLIHNKYSIWTTKIIGNYYKAFSTEFLFLQGDPNLRHSIAGMGQFYKLEIIPLVLGSILFFVFSKNRKIKYLIAFWLSVGALPSAITRDGGNHATRLILILPPLIFLMSYGLVWIFLNFRSKFKLVVPVLYSFFFFVGFLSYLHNYYVHNPWYSERAWHAGYQEMIDYLKTVEGRYKNIIITNAQDQPYIFFAAYYPYDPTIWQRGFGEKSIEGFGKLPCIDKYCFGQIGEEGVVSLVKYLDKNALYISAEREIGGNLAMNPQKIPDGLNLVKTVFYPSGEPAFYFFEKSK